MQRAIGHTGHIQSTTHRISCNFWRKSTEKYLWCWLKMDLYWSPTGLFTAIRGTERDKTLTFICKYFRHQGRIKHWYSMFVLNAYFCRELRSVAILRSKLRFLLRNTGVDSDFTQNFWEKNWLLGALVLQFEQMILFRTAKKCFWWRQFL